MLNILSRSRWQCFWSSWFVKTLRFFKTILTVKRAISGYMKVRYMGVREGRLRKFLVKVFIRRVFLVLIRSFILNLPFSVFLNYVSSLGRIWYCMFDCILFTFCWADQFYTSSFEEENIVVCYKYWQSCLLLFG